jgi:hypothetical protein
MALPPSVEMTFSGVGKRVRQKADPYGMTNKKTTTTATTRAG